MTEFDDLELEKTPEPPGYDRLRAEAETPAGGVDEPRGSMVPWLVGALALIVGGFMAYMLWPPRGAPAPSAPAGVASTEVPAEAGEPPPLGGTAHDVEVPPLDESDPIVRQLLAALSSHPRLAALLATDGLIRRFTVAVHNIASGTTPAGQVKVLAPAGAFRVVERGSRLVVDPRSYDRYNALADAVASLDAAASARVYATLRPRIEEAHRQLGVGDASFDRTLERAIRHLIATPAPPREPDLTLSGIGYAFADPGLEDLSGAQKQLLRTGPRNMRLIQDKLREIARALGMTVA